MSKDLSIMHSNSGSTISIELTGVDALISKLNRIDKNLRTEAGRSMVSAGAMVINAETQVNINEAFSDRNTGGLKNSVSTVVSTSKPEAKVEVRKVYARIQEFGGTIVPRKAKVLHWMKDGKHIFAKSVTLPPRPYFRPAIADNEEKIVKAMSDVAEMYLRKA